MRKSPRLSALVVHPEEADPALLAKLGTPLLREAHALDLLRRPEIGYADLGPACVGEAAPRAADASWRADERLAEQVPAQVEVWAKYEGYLKRQNEDIQRNLRNETLRLPADIDYAKVAGLSNEARQRLGDVRPETLGQAARIPGLTPAALSLLLVHLKKRGRAA